MNEPQTSELARAVQQVSERMSVLVREEIELAKAEVTTKATKLVKGIVVGVVAGVFMLFSLIYFLHAGSWFAWKLVRDDGTDNFYLGFLIMAGLIFLLGIIAGLIAAKLVKKGAPPVPKMAIEEAQLIRQTVSGDAPTPARRDR